MSSPTNGITPEVIRGAMPPYHLSPDLIAATLATLAAPPPDTTPAARLARLTRLIEEIVAQKPADAGQARLAAQLLSLRELADTVTARANAPDLPNDELCRLSRTTAELHRTATTLLRTLARQQQHPVPFYGTVIDDSLDLAALDTAWGQSVPTTAPPVRKRRPATSSPPVTEPSPPPLARAEEAEATPPAQTPTTHTLSTHTRAANLTSSADSQTTDGRSSTDTPQAHTPAGGTAPPAVNAASPSARRPGPLTAEPIVPPPPPTHPATPAPRIRPAGPNSDWVFEQRDQGPGWTSEVLRRRTPADPTPEQAP